MIGHQRITACLPISLTKRSSCLTTGAVPSGMTRKLAESKHYSLSVIRQYDLWWHDFLYMVGKWKGGLVLEFGRYVWKPPTCSSSGCRNRYCSRIGITGTNSTTKSRGRLRIIDLEKHASTGPGGIKTGRIRTFRKRQCISVRACRYLNELKGFSRQYGSRQ